MYVLYLPYFDALSFLSLFVKYGIILGCECLLIGSVFSQTTKYSKRLSAVLDRIEFRLSRFLIIDFNFVKSRI
jgi:hypothetical protein